MQTDLGSLAEYFRHTFQQPVVILDLETTGGHFYQDRITEIAFLRFEQGKIQAVSQLINPQQPISAFITGLTGISDDMVAQMPCFGTFLPEILPLLRGSILIAHNSRFDYSFLKNECLRNGVHFAASAVCSVQLSRKLYPEHFKHSLDSIIERHHLHTDNRHRAMSDVYALARYLQIALAERGGELFRQHASKLANPPLLPVGLPENLRKSLEHIGDGCGVSLWRNRSGISALHTHQNAFNEILRLLQQNPALNTADTELVFRPTVGTLHNIAVQAQWRLELGLNHAQELSGRHTVRLVDEQGCLKARIRPLKNGFHSEPPHGLFINPKAAKRALAQWAREHHICPTMLDILPDRLPENAPCPVALTGLCSPACANRNFALHNAGVRAALDKLPICDTWARSPRLRIRETEPVSGRSLDFICDSGALLLPSSDKEDLWYCDSELLAVLKQKFKQNKAQIHAI